MPDQPPQLRRLHLAIWLRVPRRQRGHPQAEPEPSTFRLRVGCSASIWTAPDGSSLLTLDASSVQTAPDGSIRIVWMIIGMIKAHPTKHRRT
jgi:hypothetical protein